MENNNMSELIDGVISMHYKVLEDLEKKIKSVKETITSLNEEYVKALKSEGKAIPKGLYSKDEMQDLFLKYIDEEMEDNLNEEEKRKYRLKKINDSKNVTKDLMNKTLKKYQKNIKKYESLERCLNNLNLLEDRITNGRT